MNPQNIINIQFGTPEHGWLPLKLSYKDFALDLDISNVPVDPIQQLCDSLIEINKGIRKPTKVVWHLEPYCYYLQLQKVENGYEAIISESDSLDSSSRDTINISGTFEEVIVPFHKALKGFYSKRFEQSDWETMDKRRIHELTALMKSKKVLK